VKEDQDRKKGLENKENTGLLAEATLDYSEYENKMKEKSGRDNPELDKEAQSFLGKSN
jgi:hypothetical protein